MTLQAAVLFHYLQIVAQAFDFFIQNTAVEFFLRFTRATGFAKAAALALQVAPGLDQARTLVRQRGQINLQNTFFGTRTRAEDFKDQTRAVDDLAIHFLFKISLLYRRDVGIDVDKPRLFFMHQLSDALNDAGADQRCGLDLLDRHHFGMDNFQIDGAGKADGLFQCDMGDTHMVARGTIFAARGRRQVRMQYDYFFSHGASWFPAILNRRLSYASLPSLPSTPSSSFRRTGDAGMMVEIACL